MGGHPGQLVGDAETIPAAVISSHGRSPHAQTVGSGFELGLTVAEGWVIPIYQKWQNRVSGWT